MDDKSQAALVIGGGWIGALTAVGIRRSGHATILAGTAEESGSRWLSTAPSATFLAEFAAAATDVPEFATLSTSDLMIQHISARTSPTTKVQARPAHDPTREGALGALVFNFPGEHAEWSCPKEDVDTWARELAASYGCSIVDPETAAQLIAEGNSERLVIDFSRHGPQGLYRHPASIDHAPGGEWIYGDGEVRNPHGEVIVWPPEVRSAAPAWGNRSSLQLGEALTVPAVTEGREVERGLQLVLACVAAFGNGKPSGEDLAWLRSVCSAIRNDDRLIAAALSEGPRSYTLWSARMRVWLLRTMMRALTTKRLLRAQGLRDAHLQKTMLDSLLNDASCSELPGLVASAFRPTNRDEKPGTRGLAIMSGMRAAKLPPIYGFGDLEDTEYRLSLTKRLRALAWAALAAPHDMRAILVPYARTPSGWNLD